MKKKFVIPLLSLLIIFIGIFSMKKGEDSEKKNILRFALPCDIYSLDINSRGHDVNSEHVVNLLFEGLMRKDKKGIPQPAVAYKVDVSRDKKKYTFYLRNCKWSDGTQVTAHDFEYSWKRAMDPSSKYVTQVPNYFYSIKNAKACLFGEKSVNDIAIEVIDDKTLSVELQNPDPYFLDLTSCCFYYPVPKHIVSKDPEWATRAPLISNGPFILKEWKKNNYLRLERSSQYWDKKNVFLSGAEISIVTSDLTVLQMFEKGELDWFGEPFDRVSCDFYRSFREKNLFHEQEGSTIYWLFLNTERYPLSNKKLRKALAYAIDRASLVENIFHGFGLSAQSILSPPLRVTNMTYFEDNNIETAKILFQEALQEMDISLENFPELEFGCVADSELHHRISQAIQDQWRKNLGIKVSIKRSEWHSYYNAVTMGDYDIGFMSWRTNCPNPNYVMEVFENKKDLVNKSFWENRKFQTTVEQIRFSLGDIERTKQLSKAEDILMEEMPVIPIVFLKLVFAKHPKLKGEILTPFPPIDFKSAYFENL